jgi:glycerol-3-phosphate dehydrogenase subunit B
MAGAMAAVAAARAGAETTQVWRAPGATALTHGALSIAGDLERLPPHHPLARLGADPVRLGSLLDEACEALQAGVRTAGFPLEGSWRRLGAYADLHGRPRQGALVAAAVAPGELSALRGRRVAVVGFDAVSEYDADSTAGALSELCGIDAFAVGGPLDGLPPGASLSDLQGRAAPALGRVRAQAVAFPPGLRELPANGFELLAAAPSPHGWALHRALERMVEAAGVRRIHGRVSGFEGEAGAIRAAVVGEDELAADAFVLATGRYIGGGLRRRRRAEEPLLGLEVFFEGHVAGRDRRLPHLLELDAGPAFLEGLRTDEALRPLDADNRVAYQNLRAAGAVVGGWDEAGPEGMGVPILTGWLAGQWSAR